MIEPEIPQRVQRFEILGVLGAGGMGRVYRARDPQLERDVAIKVLATPTKPPELSADITIDLRGDSPGTRDDLLREARMMARLSHQNVLPVYEVGLADDGAVFLVMEHIDGTDLATWLAEPRSVPEIVDAFLQVARGLAAAHERGIVHRDIKPANVLVGRDGRVRVADFGLSRLSGRAAGAMVRIDDGFGTPGYQAPELSKGEPATAKSDVYALCTAMHGALGERVRELPARVREVLAGGVAEDPARRPELAIVIAALAGRRPRWHAWLLAGGGVAAVAAIAMIVLRGGAAGPVCEVDPTLFDGRYDAPRRAAVQAMLAPFGDSFGKAAQQALASFDEQRAAIEELQAATCAGVRSGAITEAQLVARTSCLARKAFELGAVVDRQLAAKDDAARARDRSSSLSAVSDCAEMQTTQLRADRAAIEALWKRYAASDALATPSTAAAHVTELTDIERRALELGEQELAIRVALWVGIEYKFLDQHTNADAAFQRAYRTATEIHAHELALAALWQRSKLASWGRRDANAGRELADMARVLAKRPGTSVIGRANALHASGLAAIAQGNPTAAIKDLREGVAVLATVDKHYPNTELNTRFSLLDALLSLETQQRGVVELAKETLELATTLQGGHDGTASIALNMLALAMREAGDIAGALPYRRRAVQLMHENKPPGSGAIIGIHSDLASDLYATGQLAQAHDELVWVIEQASSNQLMRPHLPHLLGLQASVLFQLGRYREAVATADQSVEESLSRHGREHPRTYDVRTGRVDMLIELRRYDDAAREIAALARSYHTQPNNELRLQRLDGMQRSLLATERGRPREGEALTRKALGSLDELHGTDADRAGLHLALGHALLAQKRWTEARAALQRSRTLFETAQPRANTLAIVDVELARADAGLGDRRAAIARARRARAVLAKYKGELIARREADRLLR
jgi:eukaryotic-like serine/threonine-protein kinase